jgi:hypothetical protein
MVNKAAELIGADNAELLRVRGTDLQILEYFQDQAWRAREAYKLAIE